MNLFLILVRKADNHGSQNGDPPGFEIAVKVIELCPLELFVTRIGSLECSPYDVESHLGDLVGREL